jgi:cytochrome c biogenesis protein CcdA
MPPHGRMSYRLAALLIACALPLHAGLRVEPDTFRFTPVPEGTILVATVTLHNFSREPAAAELRPSCDCILADRSTAVVPPHGSTPIVVSFLTDGYTGYHSKMLFIAPHDGSAGYLTFTMEGAIVPRAGGPMAAEPPASHTAAPSVPPATASSGTAAPRGGISVQTPRTSRSGNVPSRPAENTAVQAVPPLITVALFSNTGCRVCERLARQYIPDAAAALGLRVEVREYPVERGDNFALLRRTERMLGIENNRLPVLVIGRRLLGGEQEIRRDLRTVLVETAASSVTAPALASSTERGAHQPVVNLLVLAGAALIDGINPCAFGAILLFVTYLTAVRKRPRRDILLTGACFIAGVFIAYLLIGLGIRNVMAYLAGFRLIARVVYGAAAAAVLILGILSLADAAAMRRIRSGGTGTVVLQLPAALRWRMLDVVERWSHTACIAPAAFVLGLGISLLEFLCTGQIYLPAIMYMHSVESLRAHAWLSLLVYCAMFVLPLVIVFAGLLFGMESHRLEEFARRHTAGVKLATGILFLALGALLARYALTG